MTTSTHVDPRLAALITAVTLVLLAWSLWDLSRPNRRVLGNHKWIWVVIVVLVGLPGQLVYLAFARRKQELPEDSG